MGRLVIPRELAQSLTREGRAGWLDGTLPDVLADARQRWPITVGEAFQPGGSTAWVAPATDAQGNELVLKVLCWHREAAGEADGLRAWAGDGTVRLFAAHRYDEAVALVVERCVPGTPLAGRPEAEQDTVIAELLPRLWIEPPDRDPLPTLQEMCGQWGDHFRKTATAAPAGPDPGLVRAGLDLWRELPASAPQQVLLGTDVHAGNVLAARREPWLVIDPKPHVGDPAYDPVQYMLNCRGRLRADPAALARRLAGLLGLDAERVRLWLFARCVLEAPGQPDLAEVARRLAPA